MRKGRQVNERSVQEGGQTKRASEREREREREREGDRERERLGWIESLPPIPPSARLSDSHSCGHYLVETISDQGDGR